MGALGDVLSVVQSVNDSRAFGPAHIGDRGRTPSLSRVENSGRTHQREQLTTRRGCGGFRPGCRAGRRRPEARAVRMDIARIPGWCRSLFAEEPLVAGNERWQTAGRQGDCRRDPASTGDSCLCRVSLSRCDEMS